MMNDSAIYLRSLLFGNAYMLEDVIGIYTVHESNISKSLNLPFLYANLIEKRRLSFTSSMYNTRYSKLVV